MRVAAAALVFACALPHGGGAQTVVAGLRLGVTKSWVQPNWDPSTRHGMTAGAALSLQATPLIGFQVEGAYLQKGYVKGIRTLRLDYAEMPILVRLTLPHRALGAQLSALLGVAASREVHCAATGSSQVVSPLQAAAYWRPFQDSASVVDCIEFRNHVIDFGLVAGVEVAHIVPGGRLSLEVRYVNGTKNLSYDGGTLRNRHFALLFGYGITLLR